MSMAAVKKQSENKTKMYNYVWPEEKQFSSGYACKTFSKYGSTRSYNQVIGPFLNLIPVPGQLSVVLFSWTIIGVVYTLLRYVLPINATNSTDGQYIDPNRIYLSTFVIYYLLAFFLVGSMYERGCSILKKQAEEFLYSPKPPIPATLQDAAYPVKPFEE